MPSRDPLLRIQDILDAIAKIQRYTQDMTLDVVVVKHRLHAAVRRAEALGWR